ncbi:MAG: thiamine-monophosphate kinase [Lentisphaeria bacterium]|nr:thiamine-phosphate kinase [Lentisphaeria bacterium]NQZ67977.1 thiamine-monophosphate kinase [Lentisphaeria bacterium]
MMDEDQFIKNLCAKLPKASDDLLLGPGDDCAIVKIGKQDMAIAVDQVIAGKHYFVDTDPELVGRKLVNRNISDLAVMPAKPRFALLTLCVNDIDRAEKMTAAIISTASDYGMHIIGGDTASSTVEQASLTVLGEMSGPPAKRSNAKAGQLVYLTGSLGGSFDTGKHLTFQPRLEQGHWLIDYSQCMIDISDGLIRDLTRIADASQVGIQLDESKVPITKDYQLENAYYDGEDYEILFTVNEDKAQDLEANWPFKDCALSCIGKVSGIAEPQVLGKLKAYEHVSIFKLQLGTKRCYAGESKILDSQSKPIPNKGWDHLDSE